jgi:hypothetical protein
MWRPGMSGVPLLRRSPTHTRSAAITGDSDPSEARIPARGLELPGYARQPHAPASSLILIVAPLSS